MAGIERRGRVVLDAELNGPGDLGPGDLGHDAEGEVDPRRHASRREDIAVAHDAPFLVAGADEGQEVDVGPMRRCPATLEKPGGAEKKGARAHGGHVSRARPLAANEVDRLAIGEGVGDARAAGHADEIERRSAVEGAGRHDAETTVARHRLHRPGEDVDRRLRKPAGNRDRRRRPEPAQHFERAGEVELRDPGEDHEADGEIGHALAPACRKPGTRRSSLPATTSATAHPSLRSAVAVHAYALCMRCA